MIEARPEPGRWSRRASIELVTVTGLVLSYAWYFEGRPFPGVDVLVALSTLAVLVGSHWARGENARAIGFRLDNLGPAAARIFVWVAPLVLLIVVSGWALSLHREPPIPRLFERCVAMLAFGILQQYLLVGFYLRRFGEVIEGVGVPTLLAATVFAVLHAPILWLMVVTFLAGLGGCWLSRRAPNLWLLGIAHGLLSLTLAMFLADLLPTGLKVGLRALG